MRLCIVDNLIEMVILGMSSKLIEKVTKDLLEEFGAGKPTPGSGSAAAFTGMIAAKLLSTVIQLTNKTKQRYNYGVHLQKLLLIQADIEKRLYPELVQFFQEDSDCFDKLMIFRSECEKAKKTGDWSLYNAKTIDGYAALRTATELPFRIAELCYGLGKYASDVFDYGFQDARGDSGVALHNAIAVVDGCISIISLNLTQLPGDEWMSSFWEKHSLLKQWSEELKELGKAKNSVLEQVAKNKYELERTFEKYRQGNLGDTILSDQDMENLVRDLHLKLWEKRDLIWTEEPTDNAMDMIDPEMVIRKVLGYAYIEHETLGVHYHNDEVVQISGLIDREQRKVDISNNFSAETIRYTAAHELAHIVLHKQRVLHRDRPFDGSLTVPKDAIEKQADKFAAYFLMPSKQVCRVFQFIFGVPKLTINESTVLALGGGNIHAFRAKCQDRRGFANEIARAELYGGIAFNSLAKIFGVSPGAMAIRLMELDLVAF